MNQSNALLPVAVFATLLSGGCGRGGDEAAAPQPAVAPDATPPALTRTPSPAGARVFFITPEDGAEIANSFQVEFGVEGMSVVRAGSEAPGSGHHHILLDTGLPDLDLPIPTDKNHVHFGNASTSAELTLSPGTHTLQLLFADHLHIPHDPPVYSDVITITVE